VHDLVIAVQGWGKAIASSPASPVLARSLLAIENFAEDQGTLIEQSVCYSNRTIIYTIPIAICSILCMYFVPYVYGDFPYPIRIWLVAFHADLHSHRACGYLKVLLFQLHFYYCHTVLTLWWATHKFTAAVLETVGHWTSYCLLFSTSQ